MSFNVRVLMVVVVAMGSSCNCGDHLIPVGYDEDGGEGGGGVGGGAGGNGGGSAGGFGGGVEADGGFDAGQVDAGPPLDFEAAVKTCALVDSCLKGADLGGGYRTPWMHLCLFGFSYPYDAVEFQNLLSTRIGFTYVQGQFLPSPFFLSVPVTQKCLKAATTCDGVLGCFNQGASVTACTPVNNGAQCVGNTLTMCVPPSVAYSQQTSASTSRTFSVDCSNFGSTCVQSSPPGPNVWGCAPSACDDSTYVPSCQGNVAHRCISDRRDDWACEAGSTCEIVDAGGGHPDARCLGNGGACDPLTAVDHCDADRLVTCTFGHWLTSPCGPGTRCQTAPSGVGFCGVAGECNPWTEPPTCSPDGGLSVCGFGQRVGLGCGELGLSQCVPGTTADPALCQ